MHWMAFMAAPAPSSLVEPMPMGRWTAPGCVDPGPARFIGEADEMGIREIVLQRRKLRSLAVFQVQNIRTPDDVGRDHEFLFFLVFLLLLLRLRLLADVLPKSRHRDHTGGQDHQIQSFQRDRFSQKLVQRLHRHLAAVHLDFRSLAADEDDPVLLGLAVEILRLAGSAHLLENDVHVGLGVLRLDLQGLLQGGHTAHGRAIGEILGITAVRRTAGKQLLKPPARRLVG